MTFTTTYKVPLIEAEFAVLDFETTGTSSKNSRVIDIGIVKVKNNKIVDTYTTLINPEVEIPYFITQLTGITSDDVLHAPTFDATINDVTKFIGDSILVAHNLSFDYSFLKTEFQLAEQELPANPTMCTLKLARKLYPQLKSKSLGNLVKHFRIKNKDAHRALSDAMATAKILIRMIEESKHSHGIEFVSDLIGIQQSPGKSSNFRLIKKGLARDFSEIGDEPGVYIFKDRKEEIIYIGKAKSLKKRVGNHFSNTAPGKSKKIVRKATKLEFIKTNTELVALILEAEMVKKYDPGFNSQLKRYSQNYFILFDFEKTYTLPRVTSKFDFDGNDYFGPYNSSDTAKSMTEIINKTFGLRECTDKEFAKGKKCYLHDIDRCIAPCIAEVQHKYSEELESVYEFLSGSNQHAVDRLLHKMKRLSEAQKYEQAAAYRDAVNLILNQIHKTLVLADPVNKAEVMIRIKGAKEDDFILIVQGKVLIKDYYLDHPELFNDAVQDYFEGTVKIFKETDKKDLERMKIALNWFMNQRSRLTIYQLREFDSYSEFVRAASI
jgi:DNA polymerase-3 subunit epsilon